MPCACNGSTPSSNPSQEAEYTVTYPDGKTEIVRGEHAAKVKVTLAGGGSYTKR